MKSTNLWTVPLAFLSIIAYAQAQPPGNQVLLLGSGNSTQDWILKDILEWNGHTVTFGPEYPEFTSAIDLTSYEAVVVQTNYNWELAPPRMHDMPPSGQSALLEYVANGGGMVTTEWLLWKHGAATHQSFQTLYDAIAVGNLDSG